MLLPAKPNNGADTTRASWECWPTPTMAPMVFSATTLSARSGRLSRPLVRSRQVGIVDDAWLTIGSANLNEHSFFNDTEVNLVTCDPTIAREVRLRLWAEHLERSPGEVSGEPVGVIDNLWRPIAGEQLERRKRGEPATHRLSELGRLAPVDGTAGTIDSLLVDG